MIRDVGRWLALQAIAREDAMKHQLNLILAGIVLTVAGVTWSSSVTAALASGASGRQVSRAELPQGTSWQQLYSALMDRARAGDKAASDRLYEVTLGCIQYQLVSRSARDRVRIGVHVADLSASQAMRELESYDTMQRILRHNAPSCSGAAAKVLYSHFYPVLRVAARNGNENAAACYAFGAYWQRARSAMNLAGSFATRWERNATDFMQAGVYRGDWRMVILMRMYFEPETRQFMVHRRVGGKFRQFESDAITAYRYATLRAIGAKHGGDAEAQRRTRRLRSSYRQRYAISDVQARQAQQWAQRTYQRYFAERPWVGANEASWCVHGE